MTAAAHDTAGVVEVCPAAGGKVRHPSRDAAHAVLAEARQAAARRRYRKAPRSIYRCQVCEGWHLSSQSRRQYLMWPGHHRPT